MLWVWFAFHASTHQFPFRCTSTASQVSHLFASFLQDAARFHEVGCATCKGWFAKVPFEHWLASALACFCCDYSILFLLILLPPGSWKKQSEETDIDKESPVSRLVLFLTGEVLPGFRYSMSYLTVSRFQHLRPAVLHQPEEDEDGDFESAGFSRTSPASTCAFHLQPRDAGDS